MRDDAPTLVQPRVPLPTERPKAPQLEPSHVTVQLGRQETSSLAVRWNAALDALEVSIARALSTGGERARRAILAKEQSERVRQLIGSVERGSARVAEYQGRVDRLAAEAREFRADLGRAIDELSHERSRERVHLASIRARREQLRAGRVPAPEPPLDPEAAPPSRIWEDETLSTEEDHTAAVDADLSFQIDALQLQLSMKNERLDRDFAEATGLLEGAISAVRRLTNELVRALDEAAALVTSRA